jgi:hypothetical protein
MKPMPTPKEKTPIEKAYEATTATRRALEAENEKLRLTAENLKMIAKLEQENKKLAEDNARAVASGGAK